MAQHDVMLPSMTNLQAALIQYGAAGGRRLTASPLPAVVPAQRAPRSQTRCARHAARARRSPPGLPRAGRTPAERRPRRLVPQQAAHPRPSLPLGTRPAPARRLPAAPPACPHLLPRASAGGPAAPQPRLGRRSSCGSCPAVRRHCTAPRPCSRHRSGRRSRVRGGRHAPRGACRCLVPPAAGAGRRGPLWRCPPCRPPSARHAAALSRQTRPRLPQTCAPRRRRSRSRSRPRRRA